MKCLLIILAFAASSISATEYTQTADGDRIWTPEAVNTPILEMHPTNTTKVCKFRSDDGYCWQLSNNNSYHMPIPWTSADAFSTLLMRMDRTGEGSYCKIVDNPWSAWTVDGSIPTACGDHTYTESRTCSAPDGACPGTCSSSRETRTHSVSNEPCCSDTSWEPAPHTQANGYPFTQVSNCGREREAIGTYCEETTWTPSTDSYPEGKEFTQFSNCGNTRQAKGTRCVDDLFSWSPAPSTVRSGQTFTQTNNCGKTRQATGTQYFCVDTSWEPATSTVKSPDAFTQTSNCGTTRQATGSCQSTVWSPSPSTKPRGERFEQEGNCGHTRWATGELCVVESWSPSPSEIDEGVEFWQQPTPNCKDPQKKVGTKKCVVDDSTRSPQDWEVCDGNQFVQFHNCGNELSRGTMVEDETAWSPTNMEMLGKLMRDYPHSWIFKKLDPYQQETPCGKKRINDGSWYNPGSIDGPGTIDIGGGIDI